MMSLVLTLPSTTQGRCRASSTLNSTRSILLLSMRRSTDRLVIIKGDRETTGMILSLPLSVVKAVVSEDVLADLRGMARDTLLDASSQSGTSSRRGHAAPPRFVCRVPVRIYLSCGVRGKSVPEPIASSALFALPCADRTCPFDCFTRQTFP